MSVSDLTQRWPELQGALRGVEQQLERVGYELRFVEALLQAKPDAVPNGKQIWEKALHVATAGVAEGRSPAAVAADVEAVLAPFASVAKQYTIHCVGHAHIDMNWMWPWPETVDICHDTFTTVNKLMDEYPDFRFSQSQASTYFAMEQTSPDVFSMMQKRVADGKWEVTANFWVEGDKNLASGEALCRQILTAKRYFKERFGLPYDRVKIDFEPDTFGHAATLPQILQNAGIAYYYFCRAGKEHQLFWWEAPNGARVLAWNDSKLWYLGPVKPEYAVEVVRHEKATGMQDYLLVYGVGDHGGGPTRRDLDLIKQMSGWPIYPNFQFSTFDTFFRLAEQVGDRLPVVKDELNFVFRGCYTSQSNIKKANRFAENMLVRSEALATAAFVNGWMNYPRADFTNAWRNASFNQFHDILPGSGVKATYEYAQGLFQGIKTTANMIWKRAAEQLAARLPRQDGRPVVVLNSHPWLRTESVQARLFDMSRTTKAVVVTDEDGDEVQAQIVGTGGYWGHDFVDIAWTANEVPGLGYRTYYVKTKDISADLLGYAVDRGWMGSKDDVGEWPTSTGVWVGADGRMQNEYYRLRVEPASGAIVSLIDRETGDELVPAGDRLGLFQVLYEAPHGMSAWEIGPITRTEELLQGGRMRIVEAGPSRAIIQVEHTYNDSRIAVDIVLAAGVRRLDFRIRVSWLEVGNPHKDAPMLKVAFPLALPGATPRFETPFGSIERPANGAEVPTLQWVSVRGVTLTGQPYGVTVLNDSKYGCDVSGSKVRMTLLRSSYEPDPYPEVGNHEINLALVPKPGNITPGETTRWGQEFNNPLTAQTIYAEGAPQTGVISTAPGATGQVSGKGGFLTVEPVNVGFSTLKVAEDNDAAVLRIFETDGQETTAIIAPGWQVCEAVEADTLEQPKDIVYTAEDGKLAIPLRPYEIKTLLLRK